MEAATAAAFTVLAPLTLSGYAHLRDCLPASGRRIATAPSLARDAYTDPAGQLALINEQRKERVIGGQCSLLVDGQHAPGTYLVYNGEVLLVGETPQTLRAVAALGGARVSCSGQRVSIATWQAPRELELQCKSEEEARAWRDTLREASKQPLFPARLDTLLEHIHMQDMHKKDLQLRVDALAEEHAAMLEQMSPENHGGHEHGHEHGHGHESAGHEQPVADGHGEGHGAAHGEGGHQLCEESRSRVVAIDNGEDSAVYVVQSPDPSHMAGHPGLAQRYSMDLKDKSEQIAAWGSTVVGVDLGNGWIRLQQMYLPRCVGDVVVLEKQVASGSEKKDDGSGKRLPPPAAAALPRTAAALEERAAKPSPPGFVVDEAENSELLRMIQMAESRRTELESRARELEQHMERFCSPRQQELEARLSQLEAVVVEKDEAMRELQTSLEMERQTSAEMLGEMEQRLSVAGGNGTVAAVPESCPQEIQDVLERMERELTDAKRRLHDSQVLNDVQSKQIVDLQRQRGEVEEEHGRQLEVWRLKLSEMQQQVLPMIAEGREEDAMSRGVTPVCAPMSEQAGQVAEVQAAKDAMERAYVQQLTDLELQTAEMREVLQERTKQVAELQEAKQEVEKALMEQLNNATENIEMLTAAADKKGEVMAQVEGLLQERDGQVVELQRAVGEQQQLLEEKQRQLLELDAACVELQQSLQQQQQRGLPALDGGVPGDEGSAAELAQLKERVIILQGANDTSQHRVLQLESMLAGSQAKLLEQAGDAQAPQQQQLENGEQALLVEQLQNQIVQMEQDQRLFGEEAQERVLQLSDMVREKDEQAITLTNAITALEEEVLRLRAAGGGGEAEQVVAELQAANQEKEELLSRMAELNGELTQRLQETEAVANEYVERLVQAEAVAKKALAGQSEAAPPAAAAAGAGPSELEALLLQQRLAETEQRALELQDLHGNAEQKVLLLQDEMAAAAQRASTAEAKHMELEQLAAGAEAKTEEHRVQAQLLDQELVSLRQQHAALAQRAAELELQRQGDAEKVVDNSALVEEAERLLEENTALRQQLAEAQATSSRMQALVEESEALLQENAQGQERLKAAEAEKALLQQRLAAAEGGPREELLVLQQQLKRAEDAGTAAKAMLEDKDQRLAALQREAAAAAEGCRAAEAKAAGAEQALATREQSLLQLREELGKVRQEQVVAGQRLEVAEGSVKRAEEALKERERRVLQLEQEVAQSRALGAQQAARQQEELGRQAKEAEAMTAHFRALAEEKARQIERLEGGTGQLQEELAKLRAAASDRAEKDKQGRSSLLQQAKAAEDLARPPAVESGRVEEIRARLEEEKAALQRQLQAQFEQDYEAACQEVASTRRGLEAAVAEREALRGQLDAAQARDLQRAKALEEERGVLKVQLEEQLQAQQAVMSRRQAEAQAEVSKLLQERDGLKLALERERSKPGSPTSPDKLGSERSDRSAVVQRLATTEVAAEELKAKLQVVEQELAVAYQTIERQSQDFSELQQREQQSERMELQLAKAEQERASLQEQLAQRTAAFSRELEDVGTKMQLLEEALVAAGGIANNGSPKSAATLAAATVAVAGTAVRQTTGDSGHDTTTTAQPTPMGSGALTVPQHVPFMGAASTRSMSMLAPAGAMEPASNGLYRVVQVSRGSTAPATNLSPAASYVTPSAAAAPFQNLVVPTGLVSPVQMRMPPQEPMPKLAAMAARQVQMAAQVASPYASPARQRPSEAAPAAPLALMAAAAQQRTASPMLRTSVTTTVAHAPTASASIPVSRAPVAAGAPLAAGARPVPIVPRESVKPGALEAFAADGMGGQRSPAQHTRAGLAARPLSFDLLSSPQMLPQSGGLAVPRS